MKLQSLWVMSIALLGVAVPAAPLMAQTFTLTQAEAVAVEQDATSSQLSYQQQSTLAEGRAKSRLPDPMLRLGVANLPIDTLRFDEDPMTQFNIGLSQPLSRGDSLALTEEAYAIKAQQFQEQRQLRALEVKQSVRTLWFSIAYGQKAQRLLTEQQRVFQQTLDNLASSYRVGSQQSQDLILAELELGRISERLLANQQQIQRDRAMLSRWIGAAAFQPLDEQLPDWVRGMAPSALAESQTLLAQHPSLKLSQTRIRFQQQQLRLADEAYTPALRLEVNYGHRQSVAPDGSRRPDLLSAFITVDLPLFPQQRQDQQYKAVVHQVSAEQAQRDAVLQQYQGQLRTVLTQLDYLDQRLALYQQQLLPQAQAQRSSTEQAYQANTTTFERLSQAYIRELNLELEQAKLQTERFQVISQLRFFQAL